MSGTGSDGQCFSTRKTLDFDCEGCASVSSGAFGEGGVFPVGVGGLERAGSFERGAEGVEEEVAVVDPLNMKKYDVHLALKLFVAC